MTTRSSRWITSAALLTAGFVTATEASAQELRGGELEIRAVATGEERSQQSDLYVMDVYYKPMRMITVDLTDPVTGEKKPEYVWYMVYRAFNRQLTRASNDQPPENTFDPEIITPPLFVPAFTLQTNDTNPPETFEDQIIPEALPIIRKREKGKYLNSVDIVGPIPEATELNEPDRQGLWGVAMWRGLDPKADHYTVFLTGFSNAIRKTESKDGDPIVTTKTIRMKFWRPGDEFDQSEPEIRPNGVAEWIYR